MTRPTPDRVIALKEGRKFYFGTPCAKHPELNGKRATLGHSCLACRKDNHERRQRLDTEKERNRRRSLKQAFSPEAWSRKLAQRRARLAAVKQTKEWVARRLVSLAKRQRHKREVSITVTDVMAAWPADDKCPVFGRPFDYGVARGKKRDYTASLDRFDSKKGYTADNISIISWRANRIKNDATASEVRALLYWLEARSA